jgi:hypothetical protein
MASETPKRYSVCVVFFYIYEYIQYFLRSPEQHSIETTGNGSYCMLLVYYCTYSAILRWQYTCQSDEKFPASLCRCLLRQPDLHANIFLYISSYSHIYYIYIYIHGLCLQTVREDDDLSLANLDTIMRELYNLQVEANGLFVEADARLADFSASLRGPAAAAKTESPQ